MASLVAFQQQFQATLDGTSYTVSVPWNFAAQRWYLQITASNGAVVLYKALTGSPPGVAIASLTWDQAAGTVTATTAEPHGYTVGTVVNLSIIGCSPDAYNGDYLCAVQDAVTLSYPMAANPGTATGFGTVEYDVNLLWGYFETSTLVWRPSANVFEIGP